VTEAVAWVRACAAGEIEEEEEDVRRFDHGGKRYAIYRIHSGYYASAGRCTHEKADLTKGFVIDGVIECPLHQGRFDIRTGRALGAPVCVDLRTYPVRVEAGEVFVGLPAS
jgi:3-phenylpropionate/trans-cinnamate dioxygenase ferredoxin subunit